MNATSGTPIDIDHELYPALIQCFVTIGIGYVAGQLNLLTNTHGSGLSRYIGNFALPAVIFRSLVTVQFEDLSWGLLGSVLLAKAIVFLVTGAITFLVERPRNYASVGLYSIFVTQSNDFAIGLPIITALYTESHPNFIRYMYIVAPISLAVLNPFGFLLIEIQNRIDDQKKYPERTWNKGQVVKKILLDIARNPVILSTVFGIVFNRILHQKLPNILDHILTPIAQSFNAMALFYLGLSMVGKLSRLSTHLVVTVFLLSIMKLVALPLILRQAVFLLVPAINGSLNATVDYSNFGFLYGAAPTAPSVVFYVPESNLPLHAIASTGLIVSTLLSGPIMLVSAKMINMKILDYNSTQAYEANLVQTGYDVSIISLFCTIVVLIGFCVRSRFFRITFIHKYTFIFVGIQITHAVWTIVLQFLSDDISRRTQNILDTGKRLKWIYSWLCLNPCGLDYKEANNSVLSW